MFSLLVAFPCGDRFFKVRPAAEAVRVAEEDGFHVRGNFPTREAAEAAGKRFLMGEWA